MVVCISKQTPSSQVFQLKLFSSATCNLKVLSYWNISCFQMVAFGYRRRSSIFHLQVQHTLFFGNGLVTSHLSTTSLTWQFPFIGHSAFFLQLHFGIWPPDFDVTFFICPLMIFDILFMQL